MTREDGDERRLRVLICSQDTPFGPINGFRRQIREVLTALAGPHEVRVVALRSGYPGGAVGPPCRLVSAPLPGSAWSGVWQLSQAPWAAPHGYRVAAERISGAVAAEMRCFRPDLVYVTGIRLASLGRQLRDVPAVVAPVDAAHLSMEAQALAARGPRRLALGAAAGRVRRYELAEYARFERVLVVSARDRDALRDAGPALRVEVIPRVVDPFEFSPRSDRARDERRVVFGGVLSAAPNVVAAEFLARRVMPLVRVAVPDAHLALVGRTPSRQVRALGALPWVRVVGEVDDMGRWLATSRVCAAPMLTGSGVKNKLLEGLACSLPCVTTGLALGGLSVTPGQHLLVGESAGELARHLISVLRDDALAARLGHSARRYVLEHHSRARLAHALGRICTEVVAGWRVPEPVRGP